MTKQPSNHSFLVLPITIFGVVLTYAQCWSQDQIDAELHRQFIQNIKPLLSEKCGDCHWGSDAAVGLNFDQFDSLEQILDREQIWARVKTEVTKNRMPPEGSDQLTENQLQEFLSWLSQVSQFLDCDHPYPGSVTIRKLNRTEYRNSIRDLFGIDYDPADNFPGDDVGNGFDNIADVLSLPPVLMEKYLDAAEKITEAAIVDPDFLAVDVNLNGASFIPDGDMVKQRDGRLVFLSEQTAHKQINFPVTGDYTLSLRAYGDQAGNEPAKMSVLLDGKTIRSFDVRSNRRKPSRHRLRLNVNEAGVKNVQLRFDNDLYRPRAVGGQDRNLYIIEISINGPKPIESEIEYLRFDDTAPESVREYIDSVFSRIFRQPVSDDHQQRFLDLFRDSMTQGQSFYQAIRTITQAALVSPQFLYKIQTPVAENEIHALNDYERATALSYFIWSSTPDDTLLALARNGQLSDGDVWRQQVVRLLNDDRADALVDNFASQWLNLRLLATAQPDTIQFPNANDQLLSDMATETRLVVADIFKNNRSVVELLDCDYSFVNERLAAHYQIVGIQGDAFQRVSISDDRAGVLTHASILTLTSNPTRTSPVKRGKWIMENVLGEEPPPAPANVAPLDDQSELTGSLRERMQQHRADPACASCHTTMDALGFTLENFDAIGQFRIKDGVFEIDATSELNDGTKISGPKGLQKHLGITCKDKFIRCFTEKLLTFALGRGLRYYDRCAVDEIIERASTKDYHFADIVVAIAESEPFLKRGGRRSGSNINHSNENY